MLKKNLWYILVIIAVFALYFIAWPVPVDPVSWEAPPNPGYTGPFELNERLKDVEILPIGNNHGPEDVALDRDGRIYGSTLGGNVVRLNADGSNPENWVNTGGRPLGIDFDGQGNLIVADAFQGLLSISPDKKIKKLATMADGLPILYADDVDVGADGKIYFSDASTKFGAKAFGHTMTASLLDIVEHGSHGRLLEYCPATGKTKTLVKGLNFANGVAVSHDQDCVLVNETGSYRVLRYWIGGSKKGTTEPFIENLPSFPDNISTGLNGKFWVALVSPRNSLMDMASGIPFLRKMTWRLPEFIRPKAVSYGHIIAIDEKGKVMEDLQDPEAGYPINTSAVETKDYLYLGSLAAHGIGRLDKIKAGLK
ncbi:MAG: SMP-30/gluconolactonase/LRE family protein [Proteobacteria bacterium]|nr:SMP-30/gluconolactonase/LRE family protein [Pseudomonadota bacterium]